eukprot:1135796-Amphidinium_carterae.1
MADTDIKNVLFPLQKSALSQVVPAIESFSMASDVGGASSLRNQTVLACSVRSCCIPWHYELKMLPFSHARNLAVEHERANHGNSPNRKHGQLRCRACEIPAEHGLGIRTMTQASPS